MGYLVPPTEALYRLINTIEDEMAIWANEITNSLDDVKQIGVTKEYLPDICAKTKARARYGGFQESTVVGDGRGNLLFLRLVP
ncbi:hypothetical protein H109_00089 [Trichophyton interdigitale MR816]|uniref:Uncharacterized protein n=1 Tax=Trichophyton interdigitale (strain MR816) TaxID=1215338 RepID=A0A059JK32_TRIIM|nr:hypothetical protein H109_00089 [Trichophyton interdigitale MR816]